MSSCHYFVSFSISGNAAIFYVLFNSISRNPNLAFIMLQVIEKIA